MIRYPELRAVLRETVKNLSDGEYQRRVWIRHEFPYPGFYDSFSEAIHVIYDDLNLADRPRGAIGYVLYGTVELEALSELIEKLDLVFDSLGAERQDEEYVKSALWGDVVVAAAAALDVLDREAAVHAKATVLPD
jgi:hypothetical protein